MRYLCLLILLAGCSHEAKRENPLDPDLTDAVQWTSVTTDSLNGTVTLSWSRYTGDQFDQYLVYRGERDDRTLDVIGRLGSAADTTFTDSGLNSDVTYFYRIAVLNKAGLEADSDVWAAHFSLPVPRLRLRSANLYDGTITLEWDPIQAGFESYEIQGSTGPLHHPVSILHEVTNVRDTTYSVSHLKGATEYTYQLNVHTLTGKEVSSAALTIELFPIVDEWTASTRGIAVAVALDPEGGIYVLAGTQILRFTEQGELLEDFGIDPGVSSGLVGTDIVAGDDGLVVLLSTVGLDINGLQSGLASLQNRVAGLNLRGEQRFLYPPSRPASDLSDLAVSPDGRVWVVRAKSVVTLDPVTGVADTLIHEGLSGALLGDVFSVDAHEARLTSYEFAPESGGVRTLVTTFDPETGGVLDQISDAWPGLYQGSQGRYARTWGNSLLVATDLNGPHFEVAVPGDFSGYNRLALTEEGRMYVTKPFGAPGNLGLQVFVFEPVVHVDGQHWTEQ